MRSLRYAVAGGLLNLGGLVALGRRGPRTVKELVWSAVEHQNKMREREAKYGPFCYCQEWNLDGGRPSTWGGIEHSRSVCRYVD